MVYEKLYKKTKTDGIQVWWQECVGAKYRTHSGKVNGKITVSEWTLAVGKNAGRSNATTNEEQAQAEVASNYKLKGKKGYSASIEDTESKVRKFEPMTAKDYRDEDGNLCLDLEELCRNIARGLVRSQPKLDGARCIGRFNGLWSRPGNPFYCGPHIVDELVELFDECPGLATDGELYCHDKARDFEGLMGLIKKQKLTAEDIEKAKQLEYWIYDIVDTSCGFSVRYQKLMELFDNWIPGVYVKRVETTLVTSLDHLHELYRGYQESEYEGQMIRIDGTPYESRRSWSLIKRKDFYDSEFKILAIEEGIGNRSGMAGRAWLDLGDGLKCTSLITGERDYLRGLLARASTVVGKSATVRYLRRTKKNSLYQPRIIAIHETERV